MFTDNYIEKKINYLSGNTSVDENIRQHLKKAARIEDKLRQRLENLEETSWLTSITNNLRTIVVASIASMAAILSAYCLLSLACRFRKLRYKQKHRQERESSKQRLEDLEMSVGSLTSYLELEPKSRVTNGEDTQNNSLAKLKPKEDT